MSALKIVLLVIGALILLVSVGLLLAGGILVWVDKGLTDSEGFISTDAIHLEQGSHAIITPPADIDIENYWPWEWNDLATIKVEASNNNTSKQVFIGMAEEPDVQEYLNDVEYDEVMDFRIHPFAIEYENHTGSSIPADPASQTFWRVSAYGDGTQSLEWELEEGNWVLVLMNADGSAGVDLDGSIGIKVPWISGLGIGLLISGIAALIIGAVTVIFAIRRPPSNSQTNMAEPSNTYPASLSVDYPENGLNRLTTFFRIILIIPIAIVLSLVNATVWGDTYSCNYYYAAGGILFLPIVVMLVFRRKYPRWWFDWNIELTRFSARVFAYFALLRDEYPSTDEDQAVHIEIAYPEAKEDLNRWLPLVKWLLAFPHYIILFFLGIVSFVCIIIGWFAILFTGRYPRDLFDFVVGQFRWSLRVSAYAFLLTTDRYPPFSLSD